MQALTHIGRATRSAATFAGLCALLAGCALSPVATPDATATPMPTEEASPTPSPQATPTITPSAPPASPTPTAVAPVAGDYVDAPIIVGSLPFTYEGDMAGATSEATDPTDCTYSSEPSIWFTFTPLASQTLVATTRGSTFDTVLYLATHDGTGRINLIECNDDAMGGLHSAIRFEAESAVSYLFMVTPLGEEPGGMPAQALVFQLDSYTGSDAPQVTIDIDRRATVDAAGTATVTGVITCSAPIDYLFLEVSLRQRVDRMIIQGYAELEVVECSTAGVPWSVRIGSYDFAFGAEPATVYVMAGVCDEWDCQIFETERDLRMRLR
jgi:hypothetical protein